MEGRAMHMPASTQENETEARDHMRAAAGIALAELGSVGLLSPAFNEFLVLCDWLQAEEAATRDKRMRTGGEPS